MQLIRFLRSESGTVTTEYLIATGLVVALGIMAGLGVGHATVSVAGQVGEEVATTDLAPVLPGAAPTMPVEAACRAERAPTADGPGIGGPSDDLC